MSVTFRAEPNELSFVAFDYSLTCTSLESTDTRVFGAYREAVAAIADHRVYCADPFCGPGTPFVVARTPADDEPVLNVSDAGARALLRALGLLPELGAEAVAAGGSDAAPEDLVGYDDLTGACDSTRLLDRIDLALLLHPADAGVPWHNLGARLIECGRRPGWLCDRLTALREVAVYARTSRRRVDWC